MFDALESANLVWIGKSSWSDRVFFMEIAKAIAAVSSYRHDVTFWRGHADVSWRLTPRLVRNLPDFAVAQDVVTRETLVLLDEASQARPGWLEGMNMRSSTDLEILALLQHLGVSTPLLDLTSDPLVGLYFAAAGGTEDGLLLGLQTRRWHNFNQRPIHSAEGWREQINTLSRPVGPRIGYFRPPNISARIPAQRSILAVSVVAGPGSWARRVGAFDIGEVDGSWNPRRAELAFGAARARGRPSLPPILGFQIPGRRKTYIRRLLASTYGLSATSLFPDPYGFGEWRLVRERQWNRDISATGAQEIDAVPGLTRRQKAAAFRAIWGKGWVTLQQYANEHAVDEAGAREDIEALIRAGLIVSREIDGQLLEGHSLIDLRRRLGL